MIIVAHITNRSIIFDSILIPPLMTTGLLFLLKHAAGLHFVKLTRIGDYFLCLNTLKISSKRKSN